LIIGERIGETKHLLAEGPRWNPTFGTTEWVDIDRGRVYAIHSEKTAPAVLAEVNGLLPAAIAAVGGGYVLVFAHSVVHVSADGLMLSGVRLIPGNLDSRLNDAGIDPSGRLLVGSMSLDSRTGTERLWRINASGVADVLDSDLTISNGLGWSPSGDVMYSVDSQPGFVWQRPYAASSGQVGERRLLAHIEDGLPDGLAVDEQGTVWVAIWGRGEVRGFNPRGELMDVVCIGAPLTTSCAFTGPELGTLFITTADKHEVAADRQPDSGRAFAAEMLTPGVAVPDWAPVDLGALPTGLPSILRWTAR